MPSNGDIYLGTSGSEQLIPPYGRKLKIKLIETTRQKRSANGTMKKDLLYVKRQFILDYKLIDGTTLDFFDAIYALSQPLSLIIYNNSGSDTYSVFMQPTSRDRLTLTKSGGLWENAKIELLES